jgi:hypothetical protein
MKNSVLLIFLRQVFFVVIFIVIFAQNGYCSFESLAARLIVQEGKFSGFFGGSSGVNLYVSSAKNNYNISGNSYYVSYASYRTYTYDDRPGEFYGLAGTVSYYDKYGERHVYNGFVVGYVYSASGVRKDDSGVIIALKIGGVFYDSDGNVSPQQDSNLIPFYSDGVLLGFMDSNGNWIGLNGSSVNPMQEYVDPVTGKGYWQTPDGNIYMKNGILWLLNGYYQPFFNSQGDFKGYFDTRDGGFYDMDRLGYFDSGNDNIKGYVSMSDEKGNFLGFLGSDGSWRDKNGNSISVPSGYADIVPSSDSQFYSPLFNSDGGLIGWGNGTNYILPDSNPSPDPNPDPDPDPNPNPDPNPDPPPTPDPPTPPNPGVGGTVNQYNDIVQNNDYSVTNNDNRSYNYDFNDNSIYSADGMFSDLSLSTSVPSLINQRASQMMSSVGSALGVANLMNVMRVASNTNLGQFCIDKPLSNLRFRGRAFVPEIKVCLDLDKLSQESYIQMIRMVLLFMVYFIFVTSVYNVLLRF